MQPDSAESLEVRTLYAHPLRSKRRLTKVPTFFLLIRVCDEAFRSSTSGFYSADTPN
jgi:hypothetical protein